MVRGWWSQLRACRPDVRVAGLSSALPLADRTESRQETSPERAGCAAVTDFDKVIAMFVRTEPGHTMPVRARQGRVSGAA